MRSTLVSRQPGYASVPTGSQTYVTHSIDLEGQDDRNGYPSKSWFWGTHGLYKNACDNWNGAPLIGSSLCGTDEAFEAEAKAGTAKDNLGYTRWSANDDPLPASTNRWYQHDYYVHDGSTSDNRYGIDSGRWLRGAWYTAANGGFDGRWVQLFDDRVNDVPTEPLSMSLSVPSTGCLGHSNAIARMTGGTPPYHVTWVVDGTSSVSNVSSSSSRMLFNGQRGTVTARSADGQTKSRSFSVSGSCGGGGVFF